MNPNESPEQPHEPTTTPDPGPQPVVAPTPAAGEPASPAPTAEPVTPIAPPAGGSKAMAITALVLAILSLIAAIIFFISIPLALIAIVLGIIVLAKRKPGKGLGIASVVISGIVLLMQPFLIAMTLVAYNAVQEKAQENLQQSQISE